MKQTIVWVALLLLLGACAGAPTTPPLIEDRQVPPVERDPSVVGSTRDDSGNPAAATATLLAAAHTAGEAHDHATAISYLERAVRIEPRNPQLWIALSDAHLSNANLAAAAQHARKAIALAGEDPALSRQAWLQLADVREAEGNHSEARAIRRRYASMQG